MIWLGVTYSVCAASLWPMVALIVPVDGLGSAYGLMTALQNLGLAVAPLSIGPILGTTSTLEQYYEVQRVWVIMSAVATACAVALFFVDTCRYHGILSAGATDVKKIEAGAMKGLSPTSARQEDLDTLLSPKTTDNLRLASVKKAKQTIRTRSKSFIASF
jgi:MFS family permease